jgi:hypothetical protein
MSAGRRFIGGRLDGLPADNATGHIHVEDGAGYKLTDGEWRFIGDACSCGAIISRDEHGNAASGCPLCGSPQAVQQVRR